MARLTMPKISPSIPIFPMNRRSVSGIKFMISILTQKQGLGDICCYREEEFGGVTTCNFRP